MNAVERNDTTAMRRALDEGADANGKPDSLEVEGVSPLSAAAEDGFLEAVTLLLDRGADVNLADGWCMTPLIAAAESGHAHVVRYLVGRGATVNDCPRGSYALWRAAVGGKKEAVSCLLELGANPNTVMNDGDHLISVVKEFGQHEVADILRRAGARE